MKYRTGQRPRQFSSHAEYKRWLHLNDPTVILRYKLRTAYGMTLDEYYELLERQGNVCAICGKPPKSKRLSVDHNHKTGKVRGLLCTKCNSNLSALESDMYPAYIHYLDKWKREHNPEDFNG